MQVAVYCRVSTSDQTCESQRRDLLRYCEQRQWEVAEVFEDSGISGSIHDRPALNEMMKQARQGRFAVVVVWKFDRFARSTQHLLEALQEFQQLGVQFVSYSEGIDTSTSLGMLIYTFLAGLSQFEKSLIRERCASGQARAKAQGIHCGRPRTGLDIGRALELQKAGLGVRRIGKQLGVSYATVFRCLKDVSKALEAKTV